MRILPPSLLVGALLLLPATAAAQGPGYLGDDAGETSRGYLPDPGARPGPEAPLDEAGPAPGPNVFFGGNLAIGGWGGFGVRGGSILGQPVAWSTASGGVLIGHGVTIGLSGSGIANIVRADDAIRIPIGDSTERAYLSGGYGGLLVALDLQPFSVVHPYVQTVIGASWFGYQAGYHNGTYGEHNDWVRPRNLQSTTAFATDFTAGATLNVTRWMRIDLVAGYLLTVGVDMPGLQDSDTRNFHGGLQFRFGKFW